jgi:hypothetical protein
LVSFVGFEAVNAEAVFLREYADRTQPQLISRPENANGDFRSIGGHQFGDRADGGSGSFFHNGKVEILRKRA